VRAPGLREAPLSVSGRWERCPECFQAFVKKSLASVTFFDEEILTVAGNVACFAALRFKNGNVLEVNVSLALRIKSAQCRSFPIGWVQEPRSE